MQKVARAEALAYFTSLDAKQQQGLELQVWGRQSARSLSSSADARERDEHQALLLRRCHACSYASLPEVRIHLQALQLWVLGPMLHKSHLPCCHLALKLVPACRTKLCSSRKPWRLGRPPFCASWSRPKAMSLVGRELNMHVEASACQSHYLAGAGNLHHAPSPVLAGLTSPPAGLFDVVESRATQLAAAAQQQAEAQSALAGELGALADSSAGIRSAVDVVITYQQRSDSGQL